MAADRIRASAYLPSMQRMVGAQLDIESANVSPTVIPENLCNIDAGREADVDLDEEIFPNEGTIPRGRSVVCEGFSIRGYVAKVRSGDMRKCWPFSANLLEDGLTSGWVKPLLLPLISPRFRWWACTRSCDGMDRAGRGKHCGTSAPDGWTSPFLTGAENDSPLEITVCLNTFGWGVSRFSGSAGLHDQSEIAGMLTQKSYNPADNNNNDMEQEFVDGTNGGFSGEDDGCNARRSRGKARRSGIEVPECTSMSADGNHLLAKTDKKGNARTADDPGKSENQIRMQQRLTFDLRPIQGCMLTDEEIVSNWEKQTGMGVSDVRAASGESETRSKFGHLHSETRKIEVPGHNSEASAVKICPVCRSFTSATITAVNAHMDNCLSQVSKPQEKRTKTLERRARALPKKRSIVYIFAAAVRVQSVDQHPAEMTVQIGGDTQHDSADNNSQGMDASYVVLHRLNNSIPTKPIQMDSPPFNGSGVHRKSKRKRPSELAECSLGGSAKAGEGELGGAELQAIRRMRRPRLGTIQQISASKQVQGSVKAIKMSSERSTRLVVGKDTDRSIDKCSNPTISNHEGKVFQLSGVEDSLPTSEGSFDAATRKPESLDDNEFKHHDRNTIESSRLHAGDTIGKKGDQDSQNNRLSKVNYGYRCTNTGQTEDIKRRHIGSKHESNSIKNTSDPQRIIVPQTFQRPITNSTSLHCLEKDKLVSEETKLLKRSGINAVLNLIQKAYVPPRDSRGRFISSAGISREEKGELSFSHWKQAGSCNPVMPLKSSVNASAIHKESTSSARVGKSTSMQKNTPGGNDYQAESNRFSRYKYVPSCSWNDALAWQPACSDGEVDLLSVYREGPLKRTALSHTIASSPENAMDLVKFCMQKRCSDYGFLDFPLNSQGGLLKNQWNAISEANYFHKVQTSVTINGTAITKGSKKSVESKIAETMGTSENASIVGSTFQISRDSASPIPECVLQKNYSVKSKKADSWHGCSEPRTNRLKLDRASTDQVPLNGGSLQLRFPDSTNEIPDSSTNMHAAVNPGYNRDQCQKNSSMKKIYPEDRSFEKELLTTQHVMRLMGRSLTVACGNEAGNPSKGLHLGTSKATQSLSEATIGVSFPHKSNMVHTRQYITCTDVENQFHSAENRVNILHQHQRRNVKVSEDPRNKFNKAQSLETTPYTPNATNKLRRLNTPVSTLVRSSFPIYRVPHELYLRDKCYSEQELNSIPAFCTPIDSADISAASDLSPNEEYKMSYKYFRTDTTVKLGNTELPKSSCSANSTCFYNIPILLRHQVSFPQNQVYRQNQNSCSVQHAFQKPQCSEYTHALCINQGRTSNSCSVLIQPAAAEKLLHSPSKCNSPLPQWLLNAQTEKEGKESTSHSRRQSQPSLPCTTGMGPTAEQLPCAREQKQ